MPFIQLTLEIGAADPAPYEDALLVAGASSITLEDAADDPVLEPKPGETPLWPRVNIKALFDASVDPQRLLHALDALLPAPTPKIAIETVPDRDWEREWLKDFRPMRFGQRLWICPGGQRPPASELASRSPSDKPLCVLELDPGLAFGTGTHPTTALCLEWLDSADLNRKTVIDYGCGSGVLAIAALKLGAAQAIALDIDPQALIASRNNAQRNGVNDQLTIELADSAAPPAADVLLANILSGPLDELAPTFADLVRPGGVLALSGILQEQAPAVASRYAAWFDIGPAIIREGWARLDGVRR